MYTCTCVCILVRVRTCVSACVSACVDFSTYANTSRCVMQVTAVTNPATSLSSSPHRPRLLDTNTTDYFKCQQSRVNKLSSVISDSVNVSIVNTFTENHDSCLTF